MTDQAPFDFTDGKDPAAFRTIGEVAQAFGLRQHVLRYWEEQFPMLKPLKRAGGRRYYRPEDVQLVSQISRLLYQEGFTIRGARQALGGKAKSLDPPPAPEPDRPGEALARPSDLAFALEPGEACAPHGAPPAGGHLAGRLRRLRDELAGAIGDA